MELQRKFKKRKVKKNYEGFKYLNFETEHKGYRETKLTRYHIRQAKGKEFIWLDRDNLCISGAYVIQKGILESIHYSIIKFSDRDDELDIRDILECGIQCDEEK